MQNFKNLWKKEVKGLLSTVSCICYMQSYFNMTEIYKI